MSIAPDVDERSAVPGREGLNLLVAACGAVNVVNLHRYLVAFRSLPFARIRVVLTPAASRLVVPSSIELFCDEVLLDDDPAVKFDPGHVALADWADEFVVLPATANFLARTAVGLAGDLINTALLAYSGRAVVFPSMNTRMWEKPSVQRNVAQLRADGFHVIEPPRVPGYETSTGTVRTHPGLHTPNGSSNSSACFGRPIGSRRS
ncbi:flavoprotein [Streptomyces sp. NPDC086549]|uniref:flavoprotein n=1 Tax=Streptomyces sp. NPDC086549 TaxID=3365752 RepID=UPI0037F79DA4